ncbi:MAG TPA: nitroreductase family protein [Candidatus Lokiarchaeia archaeon]|nr:nitroreductase family protein [Candidatus Lokiarchaeia archaeon]
MPTKAQMPLEKLMRERQSVRMPYDADNPISNEDLAQIIEAGRWAPTAHNMQNFEIVVVDDKDLLNAIGEIPMHRSMTFIRENYPLLSFSEEELKQRKVGILGTQFPPEWLDPENFDALEESEETQNSGLGQPIQNGPVLLVILYDPTKRAPASEGDFLGAISLGCIMENIWLMANSLGVNVHIVSSLASESVAAELKSLLKIPDPWKIAFTMRLGYLSHPFKYLRVRREIPDFVHHNQYGQYGLDS